VVQNLFKLNHPPRSEETVLEGDAFFRKIFEEGPLGMSILTLDRKIVRVNSMLSNMLGYSEDELTSLRLEDITHPEDIDNDLQLHRELCAGLIPHYQKEKRYVTKSGDVVWASVTVSLIRDRSGNILYTMGMIENIGARKRIEKILRTSEERYRTLVKNFPNGTVILFDRNLRFVLVDGASIEKVGFSEGLLEGKTLGEVFSAKICSIVGPRCHAALKGMTDVFEISYANRVYRVHILPIREDTRPVVWGMMMAQDITSQKKAERELKSSQKQLRSLALRLQRVREQERTYIAREIHDELGQALTGLKMDLAWCVKRLPKDQPVLNDKIRSMLQLSDATIQSVKKISSELRPGALDDLGLIEAIQWQGQDFQERTNIECRFRSSMEEITLNKECSTAVFRIFQETLANIIRHADATAVTINLRKNRGRLVLTVTDNGRGIRESEIQNPRSLGLLGMRERVMVFKGELTVTGREGRGTKVTVMVPLQEN
jgi:PAS domain S-box-containing protein